MSRYSALRFGYEQCTAATEQWSRLLSSVGPVGSSMRRAHIDPSLARLISSLEHKVGNVVGVNNLPDNGCSTEEAELLATVGWTPWKSQQKCYSSGIDGLNEEIDDFVEYMRPLQDEKVMRQDIVMRIGVLVTELWPSAKVEVFGSTATCLFLPTSDIDLVVCWDMDSQPDIMQSALMALEKQIINKAIYDDVKVLKTSVPIVKFTDRETAIKVDIGFKTTISTGQQSVDFIKEKMAEFPQLECLVLVLKQFLVYHNLLESFNGGISSYCLILLIISYLQMSTGEEPCSSSSVARELIQFLELYGCQFNYLRTGIRVTDGGSYFRKNDGLTAGHNDNSYQQYSLLCIEDPLKADNDVGRGCYGAMKVRDAFANAFRELRDAVLPQYEHIQPRGSSILGAVLRIPEHIVRYRYFLRHYNLQQTRLHQLTNDDDRSDCASCSSQLSNLSSSTTDSVLSGSSPDTDSESDGNSDTSKVNSLLVVPSDQCTVPGATVTEPGDPGTVPVAIVYAQCDKATVPSALVPRVCTPVAATEQSHFVSSSHADNSQPERHSQPTAPATTLTMAAVPRNSYSERRSSSKRSTASSNTKAAIDGRT